MSIEYGEYQYAVSRMTIETIRVYDYQRIIFSN